MCAQKIETFDISPKQRAILEWKYARRIQLRQQYLKECLNPSIQVMPVDSAVQRLMSLRQHYQYVSHIQLVPHVVFTVVWLGIIYGGSMLLKKLKDDREKLYRTGQISYADRESKFA